jgi:hypothetical protein
MITVKFVLGNDVLEAAVEDTNSHIDYYEVAMTLLYTGTSFQRKNINYMMENYAGRRRTSELKWFIDNLIMMGKIEV